MGQPASTEGKMEENLIIYIIKSLGWKHVYEVSLLVGNMCRSLFDSIEQLKFDSG